MISAAWRRCSKRRRARTRRCGTGAGRGVLTCGAQARRPNQPLVRSNHPWRHVRVDPHAFVGPIASRIKILAVELPRLTDRSCLPAAVRQQKSMPELRVSNEASPPEGAALAVRRQARRQTFLKLRGGGVIRGGAFSTGAGSDLSQIQPQDSSSSSSGTASGSPTRVGRRRKQQKEYYVGPNDVRNCRAGRRKGALLQVGTGLPLPDVFACSSLDVCLCRADIQRGSIPEPATRSTPGRRAADPALRQRPDRYSLRRPRGRGLRPEGLHGRAGVGQLADWAAARQPAERGLVRHPGPKLNTPT